MSLYRLASFVVDASANDGQRSASHRFVAVESAPEVPRIGPSVDPVGSRRTAPQGIGPEIVPVGGREDPAHIGPSVVPVG